MQLHKLVIQETEGAVGSTGAAKELKTNKKDSKDKNTKTRVTLPYIRGVSEALSQVFHHYGVTTSIYSQLTRKRMLVHPKDKCTLHKT